MRNLKVEYTRGNQGKRSYRVNQLARESARGHRFDHNGKQVREHSRRNKPGWEVRIPLR